jgi:hypothetical protein
MVSIIWVEIGLPVMLLGTNFECSVWIAQNQADSNGSGSATLVHFTTVLSKPLHLDDSSITMYLKRRADYTSAAEPKLFVSARLWLPLRLPYIFGLASTSGTGSKCDNSFFIEESWISSLEGNDVRGY